MAEEVVDNGLRIPVVCSYFLEEQLPQVRANGKGMRPRYFITLEDTAKRAGVVVHESKRYLLPEAERDV